MTIKTDKPIQVGVEDDTPPGGAGSPHSGGSGGGRYRGGGGTLGGHGAPVGGGGGPAGPSVDGKAPAPYRGYQGRPASVPADAATMGREIKRVADNLGIDPVDLATVISYEKVDGMTFISRTCIGETLSMGNRSTDRKGISIKNRLLIIALFLIYSQVLVYGNNPPVNLRCEYLTDPVGIHIISHGRDADYSTPPVQTPACRITALGSYLE